jgi:lambda family phage holin
MSTPEQNEIVQWLNTIPRPVAGALMSMFIASLRVVYDREETKPMRIVLEALICGGLTMTVSSAIAALGLNTNWIMFAGGTIGYFGSATVRLYALRALERNIKKEESPKK